MVDLRSDFQTINYAPISCLAHAQCATIRMTTALLLQPVRGSVSHQECGKHKIVCSDAIPTLHTVAWQTVAAKLDLHYLGDGTG